MANDMVLGLYAFGVIAVIIVYIFFVLKLSKTENVSIKEMFGFSKGYSNGAYKPSIKHNSDIQFISVDRQIEQLYEQLNNLEGEERISVWNQIQELKMQKRSA